MKKLFCTFVLMALPQLSLAFDFDDFNKLLQNNVKTERLSAGGLQTSFNYQKALNNEETMELISSQKKKLAEFNIQTLSTKNVALSFWINCYNFFMISTILEEGVKNGKLNINSVKDLGSFFNPYKVFKNEAHNVGGKKLSLDYMEKTVLLGKDYQKKGWKDARIHFAVNCASVGCPPLLDAIYQAKTLDLVLDSNLKQAFKTPRHLNLQGETLELTSLFKWYKSDFEEDSGSVKDFIKKFVDEKSFKKIGSTKKISYIDYDWSLNSPAHFH